MPSDGTVEGDIKDFIEREGDVKESIVAEKFYAGDVDLLRDIMHSVKRKYPNLTDYANTEDGAKHYTFTANDHPKKTPIAAQLTEEQKKRIREGVKFISPPPKPKPTVKIENTQPQSEKEEKKAEPIETIEEETTENVPEEKPIEKTPKGMGIIVHTPKRPYGIDSMNTEEETKTPAAEKEFEELDEKTPKLTLTPAPVGRADEIINPKMEQSKVSAKRAKYLYRLKATIKQKPAKETEKEREFLKNRPRMEPQQDFIDDVEEQFPHLAKDDWNKDTAEKNLAKETKEKTPKLKHKEEISSEQTSRKTITDADLGPKSHTSTSDAIASDVDMGDTKDDKGYAGRAVTLLIRGAEKELRELAADRPTYYEGMENLQTGFNKNTEKAQNALEYLEAIRKLIQ
jgi:hypothetical protein